MWHLTSLTKDQTHAPRCGSTDSQPLNYQGRPCSTSALFNHPLTNAEVFFCILATMSNAAKNMGVQIFLQDSDCDFVSFICIPRSRIDGSYSHSIFNFLRKLHKVFHSRYSNLHSHQWYTRISFPSRLCQNYFLSF